MSDARLEAIRAIIQEDVGQRGLRRHPDANLIDHCAADFAAACRDVAQTDKAAIGIVTGFFIAHADPPCGETDGPLGALFLARALVPLGIKVVLLADPICRKALAAGLQFCDLQDKVTLQTLSASLGSNSDLLTLKKKEIFSPKEDLEGLTHLIALERVGPSHTLASIRAQAGSRSTDESTFALEVPAHHRDRCHSMRGHDITELMAPAHLLFESASSRQPRITTIGIGDGGNEIGMGKIPWEIIRRNISNGGTIACRVPTDYLIVAGISNWGAYGLAAGVRLLRTAKPESDLFNVAFERGLLRKWLDESLLVDGVKGRPAMSVDGIEFDRYAEPLHKFREIIG
jgi:D-glutamate cyclase